MADGIRSAAEVAERELSPEEQARLTEEIMKAVRAERVRKRQAFVEWVETTPLQGKGHLLREFHEEFKADFVFQSDRDEQDA